MVVVIRVVSDDQDTVILAEVIQRRTGHLKVVFSSAADCGEIRIIVGNQGAIPLQFLNDGEGGRLAQVVNVFLVGNAQHQHLGAVKRFPAFVQGRGY